MKNANHKLMIISAGALMCATIFAALPAKDVSADAGKKIVILGDSISSGYGLKTGEHGYYDYLADCLNGTVINYAVPGYTTADLLKVLNDSTKTADIAAADYICISIGGNDLLKPTYNYLGEQLQPGESVIDGLKRLAKEGDPIQVMSDLTGILRPARETAVANYPVLETKLKELNPKAEIVFQTVYNPFEVSKEFLSKYSEQNQKDYQKVYSYITNNEKPLNKAIAALNTKTADVSEAFSGAGWVYTRVLEEDVHPSAAGHAMIAATILETIGGVDGKSQLFTEMYNKLPADKLKDLPAEDQALLKKYAAAAAQTTSETTVTSTEFSTWTTTTVAETTDVTVVMTSIATQAETTKETTATTAAPSPTQKLGDFDGDDEITAGDAQNVLIAYVYGLSHNGNTGLTAEQIKNNDIDGDGKITASDAQYILIYYTENVVAGKHVTWEELLAR